MLEVVHLLKQADSTEEYALINYYPKEKSEQLNICSHSLKS